MRKQAKIGSRERNGGGKRDRKEGRKNMGGKKAYLGQGKQWRRKERKANVRKGKSYRKTYIQEEKKWGEDGNKQEKRKKRKE